MLAKMDIKQAYRNVPVHPADRPLLGMRWEGKVYVDKTLPFGLRSAPLIFTANLQWYMLHQGATWVDHYVDDFFTVGPPCSDECAKNVDIMHTSCDEADLLVEPKNLGPATTIGLLGLELDTVAMEVRLPLDKLRRLKALIASWRGRKACRKRDLLSLIGLLTHAGRAVRPGRAYVRRLIGLSTMADNLDQFVRLNREARADLEWWHRFLSVWNGTAMMLAGPNGEPDLTMTSDASGTWGCGAYVGSNWFMLPWTNAIQHLHITVKELAPIVVAAILWGDGWRGKNILARCDNTAVVAIVNSGTSRNPQAMNLMRCLAFLSAKGDFRIQAAHIRGSHNIVADALSRDNLPLFRSCYPQANPDPTPIPPAVLDVLLLREPDWMARDWTEQWSFIVTTP
jgi:hypothetical protein